MSTVQDCVERAIALVGLVVTAPVLLPAWLVSAMDTRSLGIFRHERVGLGGAYFYVVKLRTMQRGERDTDSSGITLPDDSRISRIGWLLRKWKIDELPQLINVVRGEMAFVGPRPETPAMVQRLSRDDRSVVLSVKPGLTSPASIAYAHESEILTSSDTPLDTAEALFRAKTGLNVEYIKTRSPLTDLRIVAGTLWHLAPRSGKRA